MVQREVAQRLVAPPGTKEYGALDGCRAVPGPTSNSQAKCRRRSLCLRPPSGRRSWSCSPGQNGWRSAGVLPPWSKAAFGQRRKTLRNALKAMGLAAGTIEEVLADAGLDGQRRGETLSVEEFAMLSKAMDAARM